MRELLAWVTVVTLVAACGWGARIWWAVQQHRRDLRRELAEVEADRRRRALGALTTLEAWRGIERTKWDAAALRRR